MLRGSQQGALSRTTALSSFFAGPSLCGQEWAVLTQCPVLATRNPLLRDQDALHVPPGLPPPPTHTESPAALALKGGHTV